MNHPIPEHYQRVIAKAAAEVAIQQRVIHTIAQAAADELGIKKPCKLSEDAKSLVTEE